MAASNESRTPRKAREVLEGEPILEDVPNGKAAGKGKERPSEDHDLDIDEEKLPRNVLALLDSKPRIKSAFEGRGKTEVGPDGTKSDTSSSGYDFTLLLRLALAGITDPSELATALWHRPDGAAKAKGTSYIARTVARVLERVEAVNDQGSPQDMIDFAVERVRIFTSNPAIFELTIDEKQLRLSSAQLRSLDTFAVAFLDALNRIPRLPDKAGWADLVNRWLTEAERLELPPEASTEPALREAIEEIIEDLPIGDEAEDLDHNKAILLSDDRKAFKEKSVRRKLQEDWPTITREKVCQLLSDLGYSSGTQTIAKKKLRVWSR